MQLFLYTHYPIYLLINKRASPNDVHSTCMQNGHAQDIFAFSSLQRLLLFFTMELIISWP